MKRFQPVLLIIFAQMASIAACRVARAETAADSTAASQQPARPAAQQPMSRQDAELMLREAHGAIEQGRLEDAEKILSRVENAHVRFPIIHVGPTPDSVRRELTRAQRLRVASKSLSREQPAGAKRYLPFARNGSGQTKAATDPFAGRKPGTDQLPTTSSAASQPTAPATTGRGLAGISAPATSPAESQSTRSQTVGNPFASAGKPAATNSTALTSSTPSSSESPIDYPAADTLSEAESRNTAAPVAPTQTASVPPSAPSANPSWALPDAPRPRGASDYRLAANGSGLTPPRRPAANPSTISRSNAAPSKQEAQQHLSAARKALQSGDLDLAEKLTQAANSLGVAESQYLPDEDRPSLVAWDIAQAKQKDSRPQAGVARLPAGTSRYETQPTPPVAQAALPRARQSDVVQAGYRDDDRAAPTQPPPPVPLPPVTRTTQPRPLPPTTQPANDGPQMMAARPADAAARPARPEVTAPPAEELPLPLPAGTPAAPGPYAVPKGVAQDAQLEAPNAETPPAATVATDIPQPLPKQAAPAKPRKSLIDSADEAQQVLLRKVYAEVDKRESEAVRLRAKDPERAIAALREAQQLVKDSKLPESSQRVLSRRIDKTLSETQKHVKTHGAQIELDKENAAVLSDVERDREMKLKLQQKIAEHVEDFNRLTHEQRYAEAEIVARRLIEMAPNDPVAQQIWINAKFIRREMMNRQVADKKEDGFWKQMHAVEESATNPVAADGQEQVYDQKYWTDFVAKRKGSKDRTQRRSERELEIERRLQTPVLLRYQDTPLTEVIHNLSELTGINMHLDPRGLSQEGINSDTPVSINLSKEVSLKSALNLVLEPLHLTYVINDEVLKVTSEQLRDGELITKPYNVADLVTPIPNFVPSSNMGLQGLIQDSMAAAGRGGINVGNSGPTVLVNDRKQNPATGPNGQVLAQQLGSTPQTTPNGVSSPTVPIGAGPGGMGGAANADFDSLIDLIVSTVSQDTWAENGGGTAEIRPFPTNLSLVISQTQAVHEEIADLLQQLRRLQDLQVTIEVRFIQLNDNFFERIGIDFDMDINDNGFDGTTTSNLQPFGPNSNTVGMLQATSNATFPTFTSDLDIPFRQGSFNVATPLFGGFDANSAANFGFAILSDIEAFFLIQAAQGDSRTNVLNAPKITLFNGQQAFVADATQRPFVVGVIPVVGEFAAAQQPVIVVLNEGTMMTIQAVVSDDRRYVRMTIVPFFTKIGNVDTFTFEGTSSSTSSSSSTDDDDDGKNEKKDESKSNVNSGVTVQLPSLSFISVVTTVSVPDGGTVLLGGIKQLSEGRNEFGVPLLSKIPYINRLFKNVGIGRETESIMMMVTPRIIIQEEEEARLGYTPQSQ